MIKRTFYLVFLLTFETAVRQTVTAQIPIHVRSNSAYHVGNVLDPASLMAQGNFTKSASSGYVVVEGYVDYVAGTISAASNSTKVKTEADGDFHFEMQSTNKLRPGGESPDGLVCEIDPAWQLKNWEILRQIIRKKPNTYRKVRVYGWLRFGTESGHSGTRLYQIGNGKTITGHWEIHPVEKIEPVDGRGPFAIGPSSRVASWPIAQRYKVTNANFAKTGPSNYAKLTGKIGHIVASPDKSGDVDVWLGIGTKQYLATIPLYYVASFNSTTQKVEFIHVPNFATINYSLAPSNTTRTVYGLRNWKFRSGAAVPALQPVEMIK